MNLFKTNYVKGKTKWLSLSKWPLKLNYLDIVFISWFVDLKCCRYLKLSEILETI